MKPTVDPTLDNLRLAYERTTLAWTRTSLALIGFGFATDKFLSNQAAPGGPITPRVEGAAMIVFGLCALLLSVFQLRQLRRVYPDAPRSLAGFVAAMIAVVGIMALIATLFG